MRDADRHKERHDTCVHAEACDRAYMMLVRWYESQSEWSPTRPSLDCDECEIYDSQHCPMSYSGAMRCRGLA